MAYTVLARRYRSNTFDEVVGQNHIAQTLKKAIQSERIAHAYLFCGTRGTGKTSTARILAKCLNCQSADHAVTEPCNKCDSCKSIAKGDDIDVIEIDAASNTGVDNVREVIENSFAMSIGDAFRQEELSPFEWAVMAERCRLPKAQVGQELRRLAGGINKQLPAIVADCVSQGADRAVLERIQAGIEACANEHFAIAPRIARVSLD